MNGILREAEEAWGRIECLKKTGHRQLDAWAADIETTTSRLRVFLYLTICLFLNFRVSAQKNCSTTSRSKSASGSSQSPKSNDSRNSPFFSRDFKLSQTTF